MRRAYHERKVAPKVRDGIVQKKNKHRPTARLGCVLARESPAKGCRHIITKQDVRLLITLIPNWHQLSEGLESIILTASSDDHEGCYQIFHREKTGSIQIPAWRGDLWKVFTAAYFHEHATIFEMLSIASESHPDGVQCRFTFQQAKAFLLLHIFLHELGHHVDRMESKAQRTSLRGEAFAESYAHELCSIIWPAYVRTFGDPRRNL
jgi:hypothetical protein